jgi:hypothetical protein
MMGDTGHIVHHTVSISGAVVMALMPTWLESMEQSLMHVQVHVSQSPSCPVRRP